MDFITFENQRRIKDVLSELGFIYDSKKYFVHPKCPFFVEFLAPPIAIGNEPVLEIDSMQTNSGVLKLLSPTDCVKDRLAAFFHWNDIQSLDQAVMVAMSHPINLEEVKKWSDREGRLEKYNEFLKKFNGSM